MVPSKTPESSLKSRLAETRPGRDERRHRIEGATISGGPPWEIRNPKGSRKNGPDRLHTIRPWIAGETGDSLFKRRNPSLSAGLPREAPHGFFQDTGAHHAGRISLGKKEPDRKERRFRNSLRPVERKIGGDDARRARTFRASGAHDATSGSSIPGKGRIIPGCGRSSPVRIRWKGRFFCDLRAQGSQRPKGEKRRASWKARSASSGRPSSRRANPRWTK